MTATAELGYNYDRPHRDLDPLYADASQDSKSGYASFGPASHERSAPSQAQFSRFGFAARTIMFTLVLAACIAIPTAIWLWYVIVYRSTTFDWSNRVVYSTATPTRLLLLSTVSAGIAKGLIGPLMSVHAYTIAFQWLRSSQSHMSGSLPTPSQLATIMSVYQTAGTVTFLESLRSSVTSKHKTSWSPLLKRSLFLLGWLLALAYGLSAVDVWLHVDAHVSSDVPTVADYASMGYTPSTTMFSRRINDTLCASYGPDATNLQMNLRYQSCGQIDGSQTSGYLPRAVAVKTITNTSTVSKVAWLDDNTAVLVPSESPSVGFEANAIGVRAQCKSVTTECVSCSSYQPDRVTKCEGSNASPAWACTGSTRINVTNLVEDLNYGNGPSLLSVANGSTIRIEAERNPFPLGHLVTSFAYMNEETRLSGDYFVGDTGFLLQAGGAYNVMFCEVAVLAVRYSFAPPDQFRLLGETNADLVTARYVAAGMANFGRDAAGVVVAPIDGSGQKSGPTYAENYSRLLSKWAVAGVTGVTGQYPANALSPGRQNGTSVTLIGMILLLILVALELLTIFYVGAQVGVVTLPRPDPYIRPAHARITSLIPLMGDISGRLQLDTWDPFASGESDAVFLPETEADRMSLVPEVVTGNHISTTRLRPMRLSSQAVVP